MLESGKKLVVAGRDTRGNIIDLWFVKKTSGIYWHPGLEKVDNGEKLKAEQCILFSQASNVAYLWTILYRAMQ